MLEQGKSCRCYNQNTLDTLVELGARARARARAGFGPGRVRVGGRPSNFDVFSPFFFFFFFFFA